MRLILVTVNTLIRRPSANGNLHKLETFQSSREQIAVSLIVELSSAHLLLFAVADALVADERFVEVSHTGGRLNMGADYKAFQILWYIQIFSYRHLRYHPAPTTISIRIAAFFINKFHLPVALSNVCKRLVRF